MGCDIHSYAEVKSANGQWERVGKIFENPYYNPDRPSQVDEDGFEWNAKMQYSPISARNYDCFAVLADVRNGRGFAGVDTGDGFIPIAMPKGLPEDLSLEVRKEAEEWDGDGHSHSWLTLAEICDFDYSQTTKSRGFVPFDEWKKCHVDGSEPMECCGGVSGPNVVILTNEQALQMKEPENGKITYVRYEWGVDYRSSMGGQFWESVEVLKKLGNPDEVRIVFWFDN